MDSFFSKGFKGSKCKTLLKLTIPRIKLLRNRREIQLKQMRRDIAKLLETGQEATARIRVEHIIREEKMMAAQEIIELFCELIVVRLPIIEAQRECPIDLKESISSVCFAAPRCADLPELQQVQMLFAGKYGKEFVSRATELMPECGVNRQMIELLSIRAPAPDAKLKLLKEIAEEHQLDWDHCASEMELLKTHEDLLNGPTHFVSGTKVPLPKEKHEESLQAASEQISGEQSDSDVDLDSWEFPEVPKQTLKSSTGDVSAPEMLPFPASALSELDDESAKHSVTDEVQSEESHLKPEEVLQERLVTEELESPKNLSEEKQFLPFISPPSQSPTASSVKQNTPSPSISGTRSETNVDFQDVMAASVNRNIAPPSISRTRSEMNVDFQDVMAASVNRNIAPPSISGTRSEMNVDLQDVLAAAQAAADSAERAAAAARSAASLAQLRINELVKGNTKVSDSTVENPFHADTEKSNLSETPHLDHQGSFDDFHGVLRTQSPLHNDGNHLGSQNLQVPSYDDTKAEYDSFQSNSYVPGQGAANHQFQRLPSIDDEFSYPNLFSSQGSHVESHATSFGDNSRSTLE